MTVWAGLIALGLGLGASLFLPVPQNLKTSFDEDGTDAAFTIALMTALEHALKAEDEITASASSKAEMLKLRPMIHRLHR